MTSIKIEWEQIDDWHERAKVFGGWIFKTCDVYSDKDSLSGLAQRHSTCFVPDVNHEWNIEDHEELVDGAVSTKTIKIVAIVDINHLRISRGDEFLAEHFPDSKTFVIDEISAAISDSYFEIIK